MKTWIIIPVVLFLSALASAKPVQIQSVSGPQQTIEHWGMTIAPMDWDGRSTVRDSRLVQTLCRESHVSMIRVLVGAITAYDVAKQSANNDFFKWSLIPQIDEINAAGVSDYLVSITSPPAYLKTFYTAGAIADGIPVALREDCEVLFAAYVTEVLQVIKNSGKRLPRAISLQTQPDVVGPNFGCPPTLGQGAVYEISQWKRVVRKVRAKLNIAGFKSVGIIGPEGLGPGWIEAILADSDSEGAILGSLAGLAYVAADHSGPTASESLRQSQQHNVSKNPLPVWMVSSSPNGARNDCELLVNTFVEMREDLCIHSVSRWFFRYGFTMDPCGEGLTHGNGSLQSSPTFRALCRLWEWAPPGSTVRRFGVRTVDASDDTENEILAFGFVRADRQTVVACLNTGPTAHEISFSELRGRFTAIEIFTGDVMDGKITVPTGPAYSLPPRSVALFIGRTDS